MNFSGRISDGMGNIGRTIGDVGKNIKNYVEGKSSHNIDSRFDRALSPPRKPEVGTDGVVEGLNKKEKAVNAVFGTLAAPVKLAKDAGAVVYQVALLKKEKLADKEAANHSPEMEIEKLQMQLASSGRNQFILGKEELSREEAQSKLEYHEYGLKLKEQNEFRESLGKEYVLDQIPADQSAVTQNVPSQKRLEENTNKRDELKKSIDDLEAAISKRASEISQLSKDVQQEGRGKGPWEGSVNDINVKIIEKESLQTSDKDKLNGLKQELNQLNNNIQADASYLNRYFDASLPQEDQIISDLRDAKEIKRNLQAILANDPHNKSSLADLIIVNKEIRDLENRAGFKNQPSTPVEMAQLKLAELSVKKDLLSEEIRKLDIGDEEQSKTFGEKTKEFQKIDNEIDDTSKALNILKQKAFKPGSLSSIPIKEESTTSATSTHSRVESQEDKDLKALEEEHEELMRMYNQTQTDSNP